MGLRLKILVEPHGGRLYMPRFGTAASVEATAAALELNARICSPSDCHTLIDYQTWEDKQTLASLFETLAACTTCYSVCNLKWGHGEHAASLF